MGTKSTKSAKKANREISEYMKKEYQQKPKKIVLLGPKNSGKSTIFKQIKSIYSDGLDCAGIREKYKESIESNLIEGIKILIEQSKIHGFEFTSQRISSVNKIIELELNRKLTKEIRELISDLWKNEQTIQKIYSLKSNYYLNESISYILDNTDRITKFCYIPTKEDIIRSNTKSTSTTDVLIKMGGGNYLISDVGGEKGEIRKWINCFFDTQAIIFVVAIDEYDQQLPENPEKNCLLNSIELYEYIINSSTFSRRSYRKPIILFLNKIDLFKEKLKSRQGNLQTIFPEYTGGYDFQTAIKFITQKFFSFHENGENEIYVHQTCAINNENIVFVFDSVDYIVTPRSLSWGIDYLL